MELDILVLVIVLKKMLSIAPTLHIINAADANTKLEVHTDASSYIIDNIPYKQINGKLKPVFFHSWKLKETEQKYSPTE